MQLQDFINSIKSSTAPQGISIYLLALWYDGNGDWAKAHSCVDHLDDLTACWVHAYLHRKEGDIWNADYWYRKADKKRPTVSLEEEWNQIVKTLL
jgi:hypothetical protein